MRLADGEIVSPIINSHACPIIGADEDAVVLELNLPFGDDDDALGIGPYASEATGEGCGQAVAIALQMDKTGRSDPLGVFGEAVEWSRKLHQVQCLLAPGVGDRTFVCAM